MHSPIEILYFSPSGDFKMFNITSKYFCMSNNTPLASWDAHTTRDFLTYYSCSYYISMVAKILNLGRIDISQFINFHSIWLLLCHKLLKYERSYELRSKISWHGQLVSVVTQGKKVQNSWFCKWRQAELIRVFLNKVYNKMFKEFRENDRFLEIMN